MSPCVERKLRKKVTTLSSTMSALGRKLSTKKSSAEKSEATDDGSVVQQLWTKLQEVEEEKKQLKEEHAKQLAVFTSTLNQAIAQEKADQSRIQSLQGELVQHVRKADEFKGITLQLGRELGEARAQLADTHRTMELQREEFGEGRNWATKVQHELVQPLQRDLQKSETLREQAQIRIQELEEQVHTLQRFKEEARGLATTREELAAARAAYKELALTQKHEGAAFQKARDQAHATNNQVTTVHDPPRVLIRLTWAHPESAPSTPYTLYKEEYTIIDH
eukprot:9500817-Pyramimonas_sp.AAC.1